MFDSFLFELPPHWLQGQIRLQASINNDSVVGEAYFEDNVTATTVDFVAVPPLSWRIVYVGAWRGMPIDEYLTPYLMDLLPVAEIRHDKPIVYAGQLSDYRSEDHICDICEFSKWLTKYREQQEGSAVGSPHGRIRYYGFVADGSANGLRPWLIPGLVAVGGRKRFPLRDDFVAHQMGHLLGRYDAAYALATARCQSGHTVRHKLPPTVRTPRLR